MILAINVTAIINKTSAESLHVISTSADFITLNCFPNSELSQHYPSCFLTYYSKFATVNNNTECPEFLGQT